MSALRFAQTAGGLSTESSDWTPIPGLQFTLPQASPGQTDALITLNLPNPFAESDQQPGGIVGISVDDSLLVPIGCFSYAIPRALSISGRMLDPSRARELIPGRIPTTLVVMVRLLDDKSQQVAAVWRAIPGSKVGIDTPASLNAVIS